MFVDYGGLRPTPRTGHCAITGLLKLLGLIIPLTNPIKGLFKALKGIMAHVGTRSACSGPRIRDEPSPTLNPPVAPKQPQTAWGVKFRPGALCGPSDGRTAKGCTSSSP